MVSIVSRVDCFGVQFWAGAKSFSFLLNVLACSGAHHKRKSGWGVKWTTLLCLVIVKVNLSL